MWRFFQRINLVMLMILCLALIVKLNTTIDPLNNKAQLAANRVEVSLEVDKMVRLGDRIHALESELRNSKSKLKEMSLDVIKQKQQEQVANSNENNSNNHSTIHLPSPLSYLTHVSVRDLDPAIRIGRLKPNLTLIIGIPHVKREVESYLMKTLKSIITEAKDATDFGILIFVGDLDETYIGQIGSEVEAAFGEFIARGQVEIVAPPKSYYPDFERVKTINTFGDAPTRIHWRQKQNLDYVYLWMSCIDKSQYYIQLEDDVIANPAYLQFIYQKITDQVDNWFMLEFSSLGFIGKLFRTSSLTMMSEFVLMFWKDKPVDWLLEHMMYTRVCNPERDMHICQIEKRKIKKALKPAQFQHVGMHSSLQGKIQKLQDPTFGRRRGVPSFRNPTLIKFHSDIRPYSRFSLPRLYEGRSGFWGRDAKENSLIVFVFKEPIKLAKLRILSGGSDHPNDVLPLSTLIQSSPEQLVDDFRDQIHFDTLGSVDHSGNVNFVYERDGPRVGTLRILIPNPSKFWLWIYDIYIEPMQT